MPAEALKCKECGDEYALDASYVCDQCFGPLEVSLRPLRARRRRPSCGARSRPGPTSIWRYADFLPFERRPQTALDAGLHAADPLRAAGRAARRRGGLRQERRRQPDPLVQGPGRERRGREGAGSSATRSSPAPRPATSRTRSPRTPPPPGSSPTCSCPPTSRSRRSSPPASTAPTWSPSTATTTTSTGSAPSSRPSIPWAFVNVNLRPYYAEGSKTLGVRGRRAARLRAAGPGRVPGRLGLALHEDRRAASRSGSSSGCWRATLPAFNGAQAEGCSPVAAGVRGRPRRLPAGAPGHDRQVAGDREPGRRRVRARRRAPDRRLDRRGHRRGDRRRHPAARRDDRHLHRDRRRRHHRGAAQARRARRHRRGRARRARASPARA